MHFRVSEVHKVLKEKEENLANQEKWVFQVHLVCKDHLDHLVKEEKEGSLDHQDLLDLQVLVVERVTRDHLVTQVQWESLEL